MKKNGIGKALTLLLAVAVVVFNSCSSEQKSLKVGEVYRPVDGSVSIQVVSKNEVEITRAKDIILAEYSLKGEKLRVVYGLRGTKMVDYYEITSEGLKDSKTGKALYFKEAFANLAQISKEKAAKLLVDIKGGCFDMGDTFGDGGNNEKPVHKVCLDDFKMDKHEVTQAAYEAVMGKNPSFYSDCPDCPVEQVTWFEAEEYCGKVGKRLPAEAQWEYAAREGGKNVKYGTGRNKISKSVANYDSSSIKPVGSYPPNRLGLFDMSGNVWEWTADWYDDGYYKKSPESNPKGPSKGDSRVLRGGAWGIRPHYLRASGRVVSGPDLRGIVCGFRCAQ